ncbi:hypothetical protein V6N11_068675 [Hibiscus sabdariffa]|uniref:Uncharacterized protein n=1 Tax=Hibiscus sabdariffa TaxID=183260 RepID=A0ABR2PAE3_9ROSI
MMQKLTQQPTPSTQPGHVDKLWFAFSRDGEVSDAERAISHMNGSVLYGSHLSASLARFLGSLGYRKSKQVKNIVSNNGVSREDLSHPSQIDIVVEGIIDRGVIEKLKSCVIELENGYDASSMFGLQPRGSYTGDLANGNKEACDGYRGRVCMEEQQSFFP